MSDSKVVLIEFNELCPSLLQKWMDDGYLPNFKRFASKSAIFVTEADEPEGDTLNPWIQWYSVHTGLPYSTHGVLHLTDGLKEQHADIWSVLSDAGMTVANMSSMNARWSEGRDGFYVPDPWCVEQAPVPAELSSYHSFVSEQVQGHSSNSRLCLFDAVRFLLFMTNHGLRVKTVRAIVAQLAREIITRGKVSWQRASLLDMVQADIFLHYMRQFRPRFVTFFLNSTAHYQHCYWRHMEPERFTVQPTLIEREQFKNSILHGYQRMDALLQDFFQLEEKGYTLILATALSQQPYLAAEERGGQLYYRPHNFAGFLAEHKISYVSLEPVMAQQFVLRFGSRRATDTAARRLEGFEWNGIQVFEVADDGNCSLHVGNWLHDRVPDDASLVSRESAKSERFYDVFYRMEAMKSGRHHTDGALWIKTGEHRVHPDRVSILDIFPTIIDLLEVEAPVCETEPRRSLLHSSH